jgi:alpha-glucosidase
MEPLWWQRGIVYQVYPRSFMDSDGDGVGDLAGVLSRLDYLCELGVDALWLSPIHPSPMKDFGYDVADYTGVDPLLGTLAGFDRLVEAAHARGLKLVLDFVPNHTSDQHPWFLESRASRNSPKRDWYLWRDQPNNWLSNFGGSAWEFDKKTGQYYYHAFLPEQPDLNWRNPEVVEAMLGVLRFWLERGVDGFRVDVLWHLIKDEGFADNPANPEWREGMDPYHAVVPLYSADRPEVHGIVRRMRALLDRYGSRVLIGEIYLPLERLVQYYGADPNGELSGAHLPFNFQLLFVPWEARALANLIAEYERMLPAGAWPNWVLGNHDRPRIASRVGPAQARVAAMLLLTLRGTPTLYYGDEIGMQNVPIPPDAVQDPLERRLPGLGLGRDPVRTPMQWSRAPQAGFTNGTPWLPVSDDYRDVNVAKQRQDPKSMLALHKALIGLRRAEPALQLGRLELVETAGDLLAYLREDRFLILLNLTSRSQRIEVPRPGAIVVSTHLDRAGERAAGALALRPDEGLIVRLSHGH